MLHQSRLNFNCLPWFECDFHIIGCVNDYFIVYLTVVALATNVASYSLDPTIELAEGCYIVLVFSFGFMLFSKMSFFDSYNGINMILWGLIDGMRFCFGIMHVINYLLLRKSWCCRWINDFMLLLIWTLLMWNLNMLKS